MDKFRDEWIQFEGVYADKRWGVQVRRDQPLRFWCEAVGEVEGKTLWKWYIELPAGKVEVENAEWRRVRGEVVGKTVDELQRKE